MAAAHAALPRQTRIDSLVRLLCPQRSRPVPCGLLSVACGASHTVCLFVCLGRRCGLLIVRSYKLIDPYIVVSHIKPSVQARARLADIGDGPGHICAGTAATPQLCILRYFLTEKWERHSSPHRRARPATAPAITQSHRFAAKGRRCCGVGVTSALL